MILLYEPSALHVPPNVYRSDALVLPVVFASLHLPSVKHAVARVTLALRGRVYAMPTTPAVGGLEAFQEGLEGMLAAASREVVRMRRAKGYARHRPVTAERDY